MPPKRKAVAAPDTEGETAGEDDPKKAKASTYTWHALGPKKTFHVCSDLTGKGSDKIAGFDMDSTLVEPKSGAKFPKTRGDWRWWHASVPAKLKEAHQKGYKIVIFTNQAGIEKNKVNLTAITGKIEDLSAELGIPIQACIAAGTDNYRKPNTTMWEEFVANHNCGVKVDMTLSVYVGDAAGRAKNWKAGASKDFSVGDRKFALNIGLPFMTPEEYFLGEKPVAFDWQSIDPQQVLDKLVGKKAPTSSEIISTTQEMVLMVGCPASGKSSFSERFFVPAGYVRINRDTLGTAAKCIKAAEAALAAGKSVVADNTNPSASARAEFLQLAKKYSVPTRAFIMDTPLELASHLNFVRERLTDGAVRRIPDVGYNMFKKNYAEPSKSEGFVEIRKIEWLPDFSVHPRAKEFFLHRT